MLPVVVARPSFDGNAYMLCTSGFVDDVTFSYNAGNTPESETMRMFRPVRQVAALGAKSAVSDCILFFGMRVTTEESCFVLDGDRESLRKGNHARGVIFSGTACVQNPITS